jgi:hypothetical protein
MYCSSFSVQLIILNSHLQGPFEIFSAGSDDSKAHVTKFSSDGR